jgi:hypothetical protein
MRTTEELEPLALRIAENAELMHRFRAVFGSEDRYRGEAIANEIATYARTLDSTVTHPEGTRIVVILMNLVGHPKANTNE